MQVIPYERQDQTTKQQKHMLFLTKIISSVFDHLIQFQKNIIKA